METTITQIPKSKSKVGDLSKFRNIHEREEIFKIFGQIVIEVIKETIFNNMSKFQIAWKPCHCPSEHIFVVKSVIAYFGMKKKGLLISSFNLKMFFDFEELEDCLDYLCKKNIKGKTYSLI